MSDDILSKIQSGEKRSFSEAVSTDLPCKFEEEEQVFRNSKLEYLQEINNDIRHYRILRKDISNKVFSFLVVWSVCLLVLIIGSASCKDFNVPDNVLMVLCGGTTISTIGLVGFIVKGLFGNSKDGN